MPCKHDRKLLNRPRRGQLPLWLHRTRRMERKTSSSKRPKGT